MAEITAILEPDVDGTVHLPLPNELRTGKVLVKATVERADEEPVRHPKAGLWKDLPGFWMSPDFDEPLEEFREYME